MIATLRDAPGVGLAAPQVGEALQIIIIEDKAGYHEQIPAAVLKAQGRKSVALRIIVNPVMEILDTELLCFFEGCLSVEGYVAVVPRAQSVRVRGWDRHGRAVTFTASGWAARIIQHEVDHLRGKLYIDSMVPASFMTLKNFNAGWRKALPERIKKAFNP